MVYVTKKASEVLPDIWLKEMTMRQLADIQEASGATQAYNQAAEMIAASLYVDEACTVKLYANGDAVLNGLTPRLFDRVLGEVLALNGISGGPGDTENPT